MNVLVACERFGRVREAFRSLGHEAWSCDTEPAADGSPYHYQCDVLSILPGGRLFQTMYLENQHVRWDLMVCFPPCTYLSVSGLHWNGRVPGRATKTDKALAFALALWNAPIKRIALENPIGILTTRGGLPQPQYIQPYEFGDDASKRTCLFLKNLEPLARLPREHWAPPRIVEWPKGSGKKVKRWSNQTDSGQNKLGPSPDRAALRGKTYPGIAKAMAEQFGRDFALQA